MKILEPGHIYDLGWLDKEPQAGESYLIFVNREPGHEHGGTQTQEVLRALIDRTAHCHACLPDETVNSNIIYHLEIALAWHEARALMRKAKKGLYRPSEIATGDDGHFALRRDDLTERLAPRLHHLAWPEDEEYNRRDY